MPSQKSPKPQPEKPPARDMTTDEAAHFLFPDRVIDAAKRSIETPPRKKGEPPQKSMSEL